MLPFVECRRLSRRAWLPYRDLFCRDEGFTHISRYITGRILSPNKTVQRIYDLQVWDAESPSRRAMHASLREEPQIERIADLLFDHLVTKAQ